MAEVLEQVRNDYALTVEEVSLAEQPHLAVEHGIWSTPALIINGQLAFVGTVQQEVLAEKLTSLMQTDQAPEEL